MKRSGFPLARPLLLIVFVLLLAFPMTVSSAPAFQQTDTPKPPDHPVKLIFIHHSTGGNWLADPFQNELGGDLGRALMQNNYFVSATNYAWGPDSIGDATDIPNWLDWFRSEKSPTYLNALYTENGQNFGDFGAWQRLADDPGGENQIILFKSCFPNSDLEGKPEDTPNPEGWLSVGHAKYVYDEILKYFATRPDKLFVVITAPPLKASSTSRKAAANARALNQWLVNDWLRENNYQLSNVAVFDFYNVLTGPDNHHRWKGGQIEHVFTPGQNTEYYPSGDDHPSRLGNRKASEEFVPLLNIFYNRWAATATAALPTQNNPQATATSGDNASAVTLGSPTTGGMLADFDSLSPSLNGYWDEATSTRLTCATASGVSFSGSSALKMEFDVATGSWSTCMASYDRAQDWSSGHGLGFALHASRSGIPYEIILYSGALDNQETYINYEETPQDSTGGWATIEIPWADFKRAEWEADAGTAFNRPGQALAFGFGFSSGDSKNTGTLWVDSVHLLGRQVTEQPTQAPTEEPVATKKQGGGGLPCLGSALLPLFLAGIARILRKR